MKLFNEEVYIYETDGLGMTLPREVAELIESLRAVARAAQAHNDACVSYDYAIEKALDALPKWVLEE